MSGRHTHTVRQGRHCGSRDASRVRLPRAGPPYATCLPDQARLRPGDALRLQCLAHGSHPIGFEWSREGRASLPPGAHATKDGTLSVAHVKLGDSGTYKCVATNHVGSSEALVKVIVKGALVFGSRQIPVHQNNRFLYFLYFTFLIVCLFPFFSTA